MVTDVFPAMALGVGEGDPVIMNKAPRNVKEQILTRDHWLGIGIYGVLIALAVLGSLALALSWLGMGEAQAVTVSFLTLAFAQLWHVFNMRDPGSKITSNEITRNRYVWAALIGCSILLIFTLYYPGLARVLRITDPGITGWLLVIVMSLLPLLIGQTWRVFKDR
jgi:Ca2+-transporting ATPase